MKVAIVFLAIVAVVLAEAPAEEPKETSAAAPKEKRGILGSYGYGYPYLSGYHGVSDYGYHGLGYHGLGYHGLGYPYYGGYGYSAPLYSKSYYHAPIVSKSVVLPSYSLPYKYSSYHAAPYYPYFH
ncbi:shematrin-like protein 1 [Nilaparvata lugens]|uniref:shematrin-like protein 1 n=1 Tax=Nilaparvata lugens TaxID=108931 RepID=UPI000B98F03B|nr:shematrin-like protein 1 [Nilaparvata lugens]